MVAMLLDALGRSEARPAGDHLLPKESPFANLVVRRYARDAGPQSVDRYHDIPGLPAGLRLTPHQITVRERIQAGKFMTWSSVNPDMRALNLELPFVAVGYGGMTARLEFNWVDDLATCLREALAENNDEAARPRNPLYIAMKSAQVPLNGLAAVLEHTTYRQKYGFGERGSDGASGREVFAVNVDTVIAQDLETNRVGTFGT